MRLVLLSIVTGEYDYERNVSFRTNENVCQCVAHVDDIEEGGTGMAGLLRVEVLDSWNEWAAVKYGNRTWKVPRSALRP